MSQAVAFARCAFCRWKAQLSADDEREAAVSLHQLLINHVRREHPEQEGGYVVYYPPQLQPLQ